MSSRELGVALASAGLTERAVRGYFGVGSIRRAMSSRELGVALASAGLTERAVRGYFGVGSIAHVARVLARRIDPGPRPPRAVVPLELFCAGRAIDTGAAHGALGLAFHALVEAELLVDEGATVRAPVTLLPFGPSIAVFDRLDADRRDAVPWPDDSSHHLIACLPAARAGTWLDVGSGPALAPLAAPGRARAILATDVVPRAIDLAQIGLALSGVTHVTPAVADLGAGAGGGWDLVTFNAPIPAPGDPILARFWAEAPALVAAAGEVIVHSTVAEDPLPALADLDGEAVVIRYARAPGFAITWWRPAAPHARAVVDVELTLAAPHVTRAVLHEAAKISEA
jgi:hypothetical protein